MPELPEVETIVRELRSARLVGLQIDKAEVFWERSIAVPESRQFCQRIKKQTIQEIKRRGKFIVFTLSQDTLFVHLRMTGKFLLDSQPHLHERVRLYLSDGRILRFEDQRKFGKWYLVEKDEMFIHKIGLEPLEESFSLNAFESLLQGKKTKLKPFLLNQKYVAGLGNIYVDEALWEAKIHPLRSASSLSKPEIHRLHQAIIQVLTRGVENTGTSLGSARANYFSVSGRRGGNQYGLNVFRLEGSPCRRCGSNIIKIVVAQRGTHLCPHCQK